MNINQAKRDENVRQSIELKNLKDRNAIEIERQKLNHAKHKAQIKTSGKLELETLRSQNNIKLRQEHERNERIINEAQKSLEDVKVRTQAEKDRIQSDFSKKKIADQKIFDLDAKNKKELNRLMLQDYDHEKNIEIQKMKRKADNIQSELSHDYAVKRVDQKNEMLNKIAIDKDKYQTLKTTQDMKFSRALRDQKVENEKMITENERNHQKRVVTREKHYKDELQKGEILGQKRLRSQKEIFEQKYQENYKKNEAVLQELMHNKEKIINDLKTIVKKDVKHALTKEQDVFYKNLDFNPEISMNSDKSKYILSLNVPSYEADKFQLVADGREIRLSLQREYKFTKSEDDSKSTTSRFETFTEKFPVEKLTDAKKVSKTYTDGVLKFEIGLL